MSLVITNQDLGSVGLFDVTYKPVTYTVSATVAGLLAMTNGLVLAFNTATGKYEDYVAGGANGTGIQSAVVGHNLTLPAGTVAGTDVQISPIVSGQVRQNRLFTSAADTIDDAFVLGLQDFGIFAKLVDDVSQLDNQ